MAKFRSWNEKLKCFVYFENGFYFIDEESKNKDDVLNVFNWQNAEQSTGLFDKNGKELFVGDIVTWYDFDAGGEYTVIFDKDTKMFAMSGEYLNSFEDFDAECFNDTIIGNIHEGEQKC